MPGRAATTVLLLTRHIIARADFARGHDLRKLWSQPRPEGEEWPGLVEVALALGPKPGKTTLVLCSDLWTQTLSLTNVSTKSMGPDELAGALNFEAETLSGQSAFESQVAAQALPAGKDYWIIQPRMADFARVEQILHEAGSRLAGLAHPGGLPLPLSVAPKPSPWTRIEFWPDAVLFLRGDSQGKTHVQVVNADPQTGRWKTGWDAWRQESDGTQLQEALIGPGVAIQAPNLVNPISLDKDAELSAWLIAWASLVGAKTSGVPLLRPVRKPMSVAQRRAIAASLAAAVLLVCLFVDHWVNQNLQIVNAERQEIKSQEKKRDDIKKQNGDLLARQKELQGQIANLETSLKVLTTHRQRLAQFLTKVRELYPEHLYVEKIDIEGGEPRLRGHCLLPELADQFANQLAQALVEHGWELNPSSKAALRKAETGAPWSFDIQLKSAKEMTLDTHVDTKKSKGKQQQP